jgi:hypothetical protein
MQPRESDDETDAKAELSLWPVLWPVLRLVCQLDVLTYEGGGKKYSYTDT